MAGRGMMAAMARHGADRDRAAWTAAILRTLSTVAPEQRAPDHDVSGRGQSSMAWLGSYVPYPFGDLAAGTDRIAALGAMPDPPALRTLETVDALTPGAHDLAMGWMWVAGSVTIDGRRARILRPLASRTVSISHGALTRFALIDALSPVTATYWSNWDLWPLVVDPDRAAELERHVQYGGGAIEGQASQALVNRLHGLRTWVNDVLAASGLPPVRQLVAGGDPRQHQGDELRVYVGSGVYVAGTADSLRPRETLHTWSTEPDASGTAFAHLYLGSNQPSDGPPPPPASARATVENPLPLTDAQTRALLHARTEPVTVVSGPPGTGKSQTAAAIALDAVARGESVLVATQSRMAADVLAELLDRVPGPPPVLFGGGGRTGALASKLADGLEAPVDDGAEERSRLATAHLDKLRQALELGLGDVEASHRWGEASLTLPAHALVAPRLLDPGSDATAAEARVLLDRSQRVDGFLAGWRRRRAGAALLRLVGAPAATDLADVRAAIEVAELRDRALRASASAGLRSAQWAAFAEAEVAARKLLGTAIATRVANAAGPPARRAVGALAAALRAGRAVRRAHLLRVDVAALTEALPLWIGTLGDIESLLPARAGSFDLVILDEASMIDQVAAAGALLRAERAVVIGDPRQLRFVSFRSDDEVQQAIAEHRCQPLADRLDLRRISAFDLAASSAPVQFLDEHFRSVPHLIGFSADRFYDGRLRVMTRGPSNDGRTAIELQRIDGERADGVNDAEVVEATRLAAELLESTDQSVGLISPYRPQVDALRDALAAVITPEQLQSGRIRVGSVHGFQGTECDVVVASFGISEAGGRSRRFLEDPHLFNVLVTRARQRMVVLSSVDEAPPGILADYLRWAQHPAPQAPEIGASDDWTAHLASILRDQGTEVRVGYRIGPWIIDLVIGPPDGALAVSTRIHPDGVGAHIERFLALHRLTWRQREAFPPTGTDDAVSVALALAGQLEEEAVDRAARARFRPDPGNGGA